MPKQNKLFDGVGRSSIRRFSEKSGRKNLLMKIERLRAGKLKNVPFSTIEAINKLLSGEDGGKWGFQPLGKSWEENGVGFLQPVSILEDENGKQCLQEIAKLLGVRFSVLSTYHLVEIWDDR